jgi:hypothetical protein
MRILLEACVVTLGEQDDPWRTERRSSGWMVGDASPVEPDTRRPAGEPWKTERLRSDWSIDEVPAEALETMHCYGSLNEQIPCSFCWVNESAPP